MIQSLMQSIKETVTAGLNENLQHVKQTIDASLDEKLSSIKETISASLYDDLKTTLSSNFPIVIQSKRQYVAEIGKEITKDFANKLAEKFVHIQEKEAEIEANKIKVVSDFFDRYVGQI